MEAFDPNADMDSPGEAAAMKNPRPGYNFSQMKQGQGNYNALSRKQLAQADHGYQSSGDGRITSQQSVKLSSQHGSLTKS